MSASEGILCSEHNSLRDLHPETPVDIPSWKDVVGRAPGPHLMLWPLPSPSQLAVYTWGGANCSGLEVLWKADGGKDSICVAVRKLLSMLGETFQ